MTDDDRHSESPARFPEGLPPASAQQGRRPAPQDLVTVRSAAVAGLATNERSSVPYEDVGQVARAMLRLAAPYRNTPIGARLARKWLSEVLAGRTLASGTTGGLSLTGLAKSIDAWVRRRVRYRRDPRGIEHLQDPAVALKRAEGDCDDMAVLTLVLLRAAGVPARIAVAAFDRSRPEVYTHVFAEYHAGATQGDGHWVMLDPSWPAGVELRQPTRKRSYS